LFASAGHRYITRSHSTLAKQAQRDARQRRDNNNTAVATLPMTWQKQKKHDDDALATQRDRPQTVHDTQRM
jgi:hypothetical protein